MYVICLQFNVLTVSAVEQYMISYYALRLYSYYRLVFISLCYDRCLEVFLCGSTFPGFVEELHSRGDWRHAECVLCG